MRTVRQVVEAVSPVEAFDGLDADVLLENGERGWEETFVAAAPVDTFVHRRNENDRDCFDRFADWLDTLPDADDSVAAGAYGFVGYDVAKEKEEVPEHTRCDIDTPDAWFGFYDTVAVVRDNETVVEAVGHDGQKEEPEKRVAESAESLRDGENLYDCVRATDRRSNFDRDEYEKAVKDVKERIRKGDTFQANISQRVSFNSEASALAFYDRLRETNPAPYMGLIDRGSWSIVSSSPELLIRVKDDKIKTRPIAGTRPGREGMSEELAASEKERAEHSILVDLARNDLGKVARYGTVSVEEFMTVVPYEEVYHLESIVTGQRRNGTTEADALRALFPGGTVTGAPKPRTLQIIEETEPTERGPYTGSMGHVGLNGDATFNILIRTAVRDGGTYHLQVGGGVVHDSVPGREYEETLQKARGVLNAVEEEE